MRILIIEDDAETTAYVVDGLKRSGHVVEHASDGRDGLMYAVSGYYDVMVIDRMLPGLTDRRSSLVVADPANLTAGAEAAVKRTRTTA